VIQKAHIGRGFRGVLNYVCDESAERGHDAARILDTNMAGRTPRELAAEFGALRHLNPDLSRAQTEPRHSGSSANGVNAMQGTGIVAAAERTRHARTSVASMSSTD